MIRRPIAQDPEPKRRPLPELFEEALQLCEEGQGPVVVVVEQRQLGKKREDSSRPTGEDDPTAKKRKGD